MFKSLKSRLIALCAFLSLCVSVAQAVIIRVDILKGKNPKTGKEQYVYLLGDQHGASKEDMSQRKEILDILNGCDRESTKVLIEDLGVQRKKEKNKPLVALIDRLTSKVKEIGISTSNVDCRAPFLFASEALFCKVGLYLLEQEDTDNSVVKKQLEDQSKTDVLIKQLQKNIKTLMQKIRNYKDGDIAVQYYKKILHKVSEHCGFRFLIKQTKSNYLFDAMNELVNGHDRFILNIPIASRIFNDFCSPLVDAKIVHEVIQSHGKKKLFVIAGARHVDNIKPILLHMGYEQILSRGNKIDRDTLKDLGCKVSIEDILLNKIEIEGLLAQSEHNDNKVDIKQLKPAFVYNLDSRLQNQVGYYSVTHPSNFKK